MAVFQLNNKYTKKFSNYHTCNQNVTCVILKQKQFQRWFLIIWNYLKRLLWGQGHGNEKLLVRLAEDFFSIWYFNSVVKLVRFLIRKSKLKEEQRSQTGRNILSLLGSKISIWHLGWDNKTDWPPLLAVSNSFICSLSIFAEL